MDSIKGHISKINIKTDEIKMEFIQDVLKNMEKMRNTFPCDNEYIKYCHEILRILWYHMETGFAEFDDQLLCSTYFYAILQYSEEKETYFNKVLELLNHEIDSKEKQVEPNNSMFLTISLAYGIFQSSILLQNPDDSTLTAVLDKIFTLLTIMAYEYTQYTFITFKIMSFFKKATDTAFHNVIFNKDHNFKLLYVINHNWESPINGVRNLNKIIFHNLISVVEKELYVVIEQKLISFYWNKAKYLMVAEVIEHCQSNIKVLIDKYDMVEGLIYSLNKAGLVSAGADMYMAILKKLNTDDEWCDIFLDSIMEIVKGQSTRPIDNFINYWCLNTMKKFSSLSQIIIEEINKLESADHKLYSCLCIIQQSTRLGLFNKCLINSNHLEELVLNNTAHSDIYIRMVSFDIVCGLHNKFLPDQNDYNLILEYVKNNVNSDSSILRLNMIKSIKNSLLQLHIAFVNNRINNEFEIENLLTFCIELQLFIKESLEFDGNYQRKIATIQIIKALFEMFTEIPRKKQKGTLQQHTPLLDFIRSRNQWLLSEEQFILKLISLLKDPSDDIRDHVSDVLLYNYTDQLCKNEILTYLTEEALSCMKSRFFYQITCGQTIFKLILNMLLKENDIKGRFQKVEDVFDFAYSEIQSECNSKIDIVKSIVGGKQLHSYLNILHSIFKVCLEKSYKLNVSMDIIESLIELLNTISNQFAWEHDTSVSSDFSKMNDMVEKMIENSECNTSYQSSDTNISGLHQIVLNCLWLNVKASCDLSSILIQFYKNDKVICEKCLNIICNVLETSRHKGAIEAGGAALGHAIQQLTSIPTNSTISKIPMLLLKRKLDQLVLETSNMASVTRRGAGLSIMIHRIVSSDMKKGKPLFHYFMQTLLETCNNLPENCNNVAETEADNEKDLPKAIYIHFLTKIVIDSSLASDMMYYAGKLAKLAFDNLCSSCWQIRNAALQLYGSLIPKLIGQKKNSGASEEVMATVAVDEFRTHSPELWEYIETQLNSCNSYTDVVQSHNNLVPILSILANLAPVYSFTNEIQSKKNILPGLICLLGSPIYVVRRLTSKCILNIYPFEVTLDFLLNCTCETENFLHGVLVLLNAFHKQYNVAHMEEARCLQNKYDNLLITRKCSYLSRERFESAFPKCIDLTEKMVNETLTEMCITNTAPGIFIWANFRIQHYLETASWNRIPQIVTLISDCCNFDIFCETLCKRIESDKCIDEEILIQLSRSLYALAFKRKSTIIWRTLYELSLHTQSLNKHIDTSLLHQYLLDNEVLYRMRYMIAFAARLLTDNACEDLLTLSSIIFKLSYPETDIDMRLVAATANNELASKFKNLSDCTKINTLKAAIMFLQDEDEDVRNLSVHFYRKLNNESIATHPYICWKKILSKNFLHNALDDSHTGIPALCNDLLDLLKSLNIPNEDEYNPFTNDSKNIYLETHVLKKVLVDLIS